MYLAYHDYEGSSQLGKIGKKLKKVRKVVKKVAKVAAVGAAFVVAPAAATVAMRALQQRKERKALTAAAAESARQTEALLRPQIPATALMPVMLPPPPQLAPSGAIVTPLTPDSAPLPMMPAVLGPSAAAFGPTVERGYVPGPRVTMPIGPDDRGDVQVSPAAPRPAPPWLIPAVIGGAALLFLPALMKRR